VILGLAAPPERLATLAVEVEGGGIEEHQVEIVSSSSRSRIDHSTAIWPYSGGKPFGQVSSVIEPNPRNLLHKQIF
jgi:hypothetical protein